MDKILNLLKEGAAAISLSPKEEPLPKIHKVTNSELQKKDQVKSIVTSGELNTVNSK